MRIKILGSNVDCLTMEETKDQVIQLIEKRKPTQHVVVNASKINLMHENEALKEIVNACPLINADGQSIVWAARFLGHEIPGRVAGIDLFNELIGICAKKNYAPYFFGAEQVVVEQVVAHYQTIYPNLNVAGFRNGYFADNESESIAEEIAASKADILFVAFSSPKKEFWIHQYLTLMNVPFCMGVGGSFDVVAGKIKRAPVWMQKSGLEWFHRFVKEPRRMFKRYIVGNVRFIVRTIRAKYK